MIVRVREALRSAAPWQLGLALIAACWIAGSIAVVFGTRHAGVFTQELERWPFLFAWIRWDARWYGMIAADGYSFTPGEQSAVAFFPGYPLLMRALTWLGINVFVAGIAVSVAAGLGAVTVFRRWAERVSDVETARTATLALMVYPFAFFLYGPVYSDALFLLLGAGAFLCIEQRKVGLATLLAAAASATRPVGLAVTAGIWIRQLELRRREEGHLRLRVMDLVPLLGAIGLAAYMAFLAWRFGDPFAFVTAQQGWHQQPGWHTWLKTEFFTAPVHPKRNVYALLHGVLCIAATLSSWPVARRLGWGYGIYVLLVCGFPLLSSDAFIGVGRYALGGFPAFIFAAQWFATRRKAAPWVWVGSLAVMLVLAAKFATGRYVS